MLGQERLAELTWLVGYYSALALALAVFRPFLPEPFMTAYQAGDQRAYPPWPAIGLPNVSLKARLFTSGRCSLRGNGRAG